VKSGDVAKRNNGVLVSMTGGTALAYALFTLQDRGRCSSARKRKCTKA